MKKMKFLLPLAAILLAVSASFATTKWANMGVVSTAVDVSFGGGGTCVKEGTCTGTGSTCQIGGACNQTFYVNGFTCPVPALGAFAQ